MNGLRSAVKTTLTVGSIALALLLFPSSAQAAPPAPTGLTATAGNAQVSLSWNASTGATSYSVFRGPSAGTEGTTAITSGIAATGTIDFTVANGTTYFYKVKAVNSTGSSGNSNEASATPSAGSAPLAPTGLTATAGNAQVSLSWTASAGATSYSVFRGTTANGEGATAITGGVTATGTIDFTAANGTTYFYKVKAVNSTGSSGNSSEASATPSAGGGAPFANGTYTLAPANANSTRLDVAGAGTTDGTNVDIVTSASASNQQWIFTNVSGSTYRISPVHASAQCLDVSGQLNVSGTNVQIWQYLSQTNQQWTLTAVSGGYTLTPTHAAALRLNATGNATASNVNVVTANSSTAQTWNIVAVTGSTPPAPTGLTATAGNAQVSLSWNASSGATSYSVFRGTAANGEGTTAISSGGTFTNLTDTGRTIGTTYFYKVKAVNSFGTSGNSNEASATPVAGGGGSQTIGGGTIGSPAVGPAPTYGIGGAGAVLVKNWDFGTNGTIKSRTDLNQEFQYTDQFGVGAGGGGQYGSLFVASDAAHVQWAGQRYDGQNATVNGVTTTTPNTRDFLADTLRTYLVPLDNATTVQASSQNVGCGSIIAKWALPNGGSLLGKDLVWEVRVKYVTPPYFWFAIWTSGNQWNNGAEMDVQESFGYDNTSQGGGTNYLGRYWHVNSVGGSDNVNYNNWDAGMSSAGIPIPPAANAWDATQYHIWTWLYRRNNTYSVYMDNIQVQSGTINWTNGNGPGTLTPAGGTPINMYFELDGAWGHTAIQSVNQPMAASQLTGKYYDWDYSRVYLVP